jgi:hypothetical protein
VRLRGRSRRESGQHENESGLGRGRHRDVIQGLGGNDVIHGLGGNDLICGGGGNDRIYGGGSDELLGQLGNDGLWGGDGDDSLIGAAGNDLLDGGSGSNRGVGNRGIDTCLRPLGGGRRPASPAPHEANVARTSTTRATGCEPSSLARQFVETGFPWGQVGPTTSKSTATTIATRCTTTTTAVSGENSPYHG